MQDLISRREAIDAIMKELKDRSLHDDKETSEDFADGYDEGIGDAATRVYLMPSAQPDIKQAAKLLSDFIESCPGGDSYLITPDGEKLRTDWGYAMEGIQLIHDWAERRTDE